MSRIVIMKKIKSFISRVANKIFMNSDWYCEGFWKGTTKFWNIQSCDYDIINLGSNSGKYSFCYDNLPVKGMNWAVGPQSLMHDFNILKNYFSHLKEGGIVLIPLCPFSCLQSPYKKESNFKYYPILHPATIIDFDDSERTRAYKIKSNPLKEMPIYCIKNTLKELVKKIYKNLRSIPKINYQEDADMWINLWKEQFGIMDLDASMKEKHLMERSKRAKTLRKMISFCNERNLKAYVVLPPIHPALLSRFSQSFIKHYIYDFIHEAVDDKNKLIDHLGNVSFHKDEYFQNAYFMNGKGASKFTELILKDLGLLN